MNTLYKGYIKTKGKKAIEAFKDRTKYRTYDEVKNLEGFGGVLADDTILIDIDDAEQSEILMSIVEEYQLDCRVYCTSRGRHFLFKNHSITRNRTHVPLAVGLTADIKLGTRSSYEIIKIDGEERFIEWDIEEGGAYQEVPKWLFPVRTAVDFLDMDAGDGRNQALFNYILTLTSNDFSVDDTRECIRILNRFVLKEPLSDDELEVILRDEAFQKPVFFCDKTFLFDRFATWLKNTYHVVKINNQLYIYQNGIYVEGENLGTVIRENIPNIKKNQKAEVLDCLLKELLDRHATPSNIDDRGTFTELKKSVNKTKAENFFRLVFKDDYVPLRLPIYSENYLRDFIFSGGKDPYLNVIEVEQTSAYTPDDAREYNKPKVVVVKLTDNDYVGREIRTSVSYKTLENWYSESNAVKSVIESECFAYVEDKLCVATSECLERTDDGKIRLTEYAKTHEEECFLQFIVDEKDGTLHYVKLPKSKADEAFNYNDAITEDLLSQYGLVNEMSKEMLNAIDGEEFGPALDILMDKHICNYTAKHSNIQDV